MNKRVSLFCIILLGINITLFAQDIPPFPSIDEAYNKVINKESVYAKLKRDYKIENPRDCKIEKKMIIGGGDIIPSEFGSYQSDELRQINYRLPDDRCYTVFLVTTPESSEGVTYKLPLVVEYYRMKNAIMYNKWDFYYWYFDNAYEVKGGKDDPVLYKVLIEKLEQLNFDINTSLRSRGDHPMPDALVYFTTIDKIEKAPNSQDIRKMDYWEYDEFYRDYIVYGNTIEFEDYEEGKVKQNYSDSKAILSVKFQRDKDKNGKTGEWYWYAFYQTARSVEHGKPVEDQNLYHTAGSIGFKEVFNKPAKTKLPPYNSEVYDEYIENEIKQLFISMYNGEEGAKDNLFKHIAPENGEQIISSFEDYFKDLKDKFVKIKTDENGQPMVNVSVSDVHRPESYNGSVYITVKEQRIGIDKDKSLKKVYKNAGMSKAAMAKFSGGFNNSGSYKMKCILLDGQIKIAEPIKRSSEIPF